MNETILQDRKADFTHDLRTRGYAVCNHVSKIARDFFAQWQRVLAYEEKAQSAFASELGFCVVHIWQLDEMSSPLGESSGLTRLTKRVAEKLSRSERRSDLINSDEEDAYLRALIHHVGAKDYFSP